MDQLADLALAALTSWQAQVVLGLIFLDLLLGVASAVKRRAFEWQRVADYYYENVIPYLIGYVALYVAIHLLIPPDALGGFGGELSAGAVGVAWLTLLSSLLASIGSNLRELYPPSRLSGTHLKDDSV